MPYDPNIPINGEIVDADELRTQFAALHEETVAANERIDNIPAGPPGADGSDGAPGEPFAQVVVDAVNTLPPGESATVEASFDGVNVHLTFGIPAGEPGAEGAQGSPGEVTGQQLADALTAALAGTARNPIEIESFSGSFSDPPTQSEMQAFAAWSEAFRAAVVRSS